MNDQRLAAPTKTPASKIPSLELKMREYLEQLDNCSFEWRSSRATEIVGQGSVKIDFSENSADCLALLAKGDLRSWLESYLYGHWSSHRLLSLVHEFVKKGNFPKKTTFSWLRPFLKIYQDWNHTPKNHSLDFLKNHFGLSELFFEQLLDKKYRLYLPALYPHPGASLEQASQWQLQRMCEKLNLLPTDRLLDFGSGWGSLGLYAAEHYGVQAVIVSFSSLHHKSIERLIHIRGLSTQVQVISYEEAFAPQQWYQKIAFLFPIDWTGVAHQKDLLSQASHHLSPEGLMLTQQITVQDSHFGDFLESFFQDYVLESYALYSAENLHKKGQLPLNCRLIHQESLDEHAARTSRDWAAHLSEKTSFLTERGLDGYFIRLYQAKLALFYAGFCTRKIQYSQCIWAGHQYMGGDWLLSHAKSAYFPSPYIKNFD